MSRTPLRISLAAGGTLLFAPAALAQNYAITWYSVDGGGSTLAVAGPYQLGSTAGQHDAGPLLSAGSESLSGGFWTVAGPLPPPPCPADFNQNGIVSVQDIFDFLAAYFGNDPRADFNSSGIVSVQDIFDFLAAYFTGC